MPPQVNANGSNGQYHTKLDNCYVIMINKNYNNNAVDSSSITALEKDMDK